MKTAFDPKILVQFRHEKYWTQEDLATASGVSTRTIQRIEQSGGGSLETWKSLAAAFDVDVRTLEIESDSKSSDRFDPRIQYMAMGVTFSACIVGCFFSWLPVLLGFSRGDGFATVWLFLIVAVGMTVYSTALLTWNWLRLNRVS